MSMGTLQTTNPGTSGTFNFDLLRFMEGSPNDSQRAIGQPIVSMGVNNSRLRWNRKDYKPFSFIALCYTATYDDAVAMADSFRGYLGYVVTLAYTADGVAYPASMKYFLLDDSGAGPTREDGIGGAISPSQGVCNFHISLQATGITL